MAAQDADTVACPTCHGEPCDKCGGSGKQIEEHAPWAREVVGCGWCYGQPCPACGRYNRRDRTMNKHLRERIRELQRIMLEMYATLDHSAEERGETCWSCYLQGEANKLFEGYDPARYDGKVSGVQ